MKRHAAHHALSPFVLLFVLGMACAWTIQAAGATPLQRDILELEKHVIAKSGDIEAKLQLARLYIVSGETQDARTLLEQVLEQNPGDPDVLTELGFLNDATGQPKMARAYYMRALAKDPDHPVAYMNLGLSYLSSGETDNAVAALESAITANTKLLTQLRRRPPSGPDQLRDYNNLQVFYLSNLAICERAFGNMEQSLAYLEQAQLLAPSDRILAANIETVRSQMRDTTSSRLVTSDQLAALAQTPAPAPAAVPAVSAPQAPLPEEIRKTVVRSPDAQSVPLDAPMPRPGPDTTATPEEPPASVSRHEPAAHTAGPGIKSEPAPRVPSQATPVTASPAEAAPGDSLKQHFDAGAAALARGDYETAIADLVRATHFNPDHAPTYRHLAEAYHRTGQRDKALRAAQRAVELNADAEDAQILLGVLETATGNARAGEDRITKIIQKKQDDLPARIALCTVLRDSAQEVRAIAFGRQWVDGAPDSVDALECLVSALRKRGRLFEALLALKDALEINPSDARLLSLKSDLVQEARAQNIGIPEFPSPDKPPAKVVRIGLDENSDHPLAQFPGFETLVPSPPLNEAVLTVTPPSGKVPGRKQPIPLPPSLSEEIKDQISAFQADAYMAPPNWEYDWELLYKLSGQLQGHWVYQGNGGRLYAMQIGNPPGALLARGSQPALSADGQALVFIDSSRSSHAVKVLNTTTHASETLLDVSRFKQAARVFFRAPALSPNRRYLSVLANMGTGEYEIVILDTVNDALLRPLPSQNALATAWDATGRRIIFSISPCTRTPAGDRTCLGDFNLDTGLVTWFDTTAPRKGAPGRVPLGSIKSPIPVLSPSGKYLLIYSSEDYINTIVVLDMQTGEATPLDPHDINGKRIAALGLAWSPDETHFVFTRLNGIWVMDADGQNAFPAQQSVGALPPVLWRP